MEMMKAGHDQPRSSSSCAACKLLKRRCTPVCIFAPYFRSDEPKKFAKVHKVFGASNVSKILIEVPEEQREDTVNSLAYEAEARLRDPVYGCIGAIAILQRKMVELQHDLAVARARLARIATATSAAAAGSGGGSLEDQLNVVAAPPFGDCYYLGSCSGLGVSEGFYQESTVEWPGENGADAAMAMGGAGDFGHTPFLL